MNADPHIAYTTVNAADAEHYTCPISGRSTVDQAGKFAVLWEGRPLDPDAAAETAPELTAILAHVDQDAARAAIDADPRYNGPSWLTVRPTPDPNDRHAESLCPVANPDGHPNGAHRDPRPFGIAAGRYGGSEVNGPAFYSRLAGQRKAPALAAALDAYYGTDPEPEPVPPAPPVPTPEQVAAAARAARRAEAIADVARAIFGDEFRPGHAEAAYRLLDAAERYLAE